jgi:hypothetical protein
MRTRLAVALAITLAATAAGAGASTEVPARWGAYRLELVDEAGRVLPAWSHQGRTYTLGRKGERYLVRVRNESGRRAEVVVSVDGRDVVDGRPASFAKRGYLVEPGGEVTIDGYRLNDAAVAAFRFSSVSSSYASRMGDARDVGVIGVAVFPERVQPVAVPEPLPRPPAQRGASPESEAPEARSSAEAPGGRSESAPSASAPRAKRDTARPGLGTAFGEERESHVVEAPFERAHSTPEAVLTLRYDDRRGLLALGIDVDGRRRERDESRLRESANAFRGSGYAEPPPGWRP